MSVVNQETATTIEYPESDGKPLGETDVHIELIIDLRCALRDFFRNASMEVEGGRLRSEALGLELVDTGETLRLYDPQAQRFLPTPAEESEANRLREELERLRRATDVK